MMNGYGTATSPSSASSSDNSGSFCRSPPSPESTPLLQFGRIDGGAPSEYWNERDGTNISACNSNRVVISLLGIIWLASVIFLGNMGNAILHAMNDASGTNNEAASSSTGGTNTGRGRGGGTRFSRYNKKWSDIITPLVSATVSEITGSSPGDDLGATLIQEGGAAAETVAAAALTASSSSSTKSVTTQSVGPTNVTILVVYGPEYHHYISRFAWEVAKGVLSSYNTNRHAVAGQLLFGHTDNITFSDVLNADAVIVGSPVYNANTHPYVQQWMNNFQIQADLSRKVGAAFVTAGGLHAGADSALMSILRSLMIFQMVAVGGASWDSPFGAAATVYEEPFGDQNVARPDFARACYENVHGTIHPHFLHKAYQLGARVANVTFALHM
mmetsp:Transcript_18608/g.40296  ORF Transcript_18608/g.40296 Transcript_18608/m.40296 type:complete len:386 (-) Transcript_18608:55-1212(-)